MTHGARGAGDSHGIGARESLRTAAQEWERRWRDESARGAWREPEPAVAGIAPTLARRGFRRVLDVGCGVGRHALLFAGKGFDVAAVDASRNGVDELGRIARARRVHVDACFADFTMLPFGDETFDYVVAWNVLYHGDGEDARAAFAECRRVLRAGGLFHVTMLSTRNVGFGCGREIRPDTFVVDDPASEKHHPHFYVDAAALFQMLTAACFVPRSLVDVDQKPPGRAFHWIALSQAR